MKRMPGSIYHSPIGNLLLEADDKALVALRFDDGATAGLVDLPASSSVIDIARRWLDSYFAGQRPVSLPPIRLVGTPFCRLVWQELTTVPYGQTVSYGELGRRVGCRSAQAVGRAVGRNPIAIIVPCHRVVGADGSLTGYAYGLDRKRSLLQLEGYMNQHR